MLDGGVIAHINMSWVHPRLPRRSRHLPGGRNARLGRRRPHRLRDPAAPGHAAPVWNPDQQQTIDFLQHLAAGAGQHGLRQRLQDRSGRCSSATSSRMRPIRYTLVEGAKGVQLVECALESWRERRWVDVPPLNVGASKEKQHEPA